MYLSEAVTAPFTRSGSAFDGIEISYGACLEAPNMILTLAFLAQGLSDTCSAFIVKPHPELGFIGVIDCETPPNLLLATGGCVWVNLDWNQCGCWIGDKLNCDELSPADDTTWGQIKAMYYNN
jgi:hypothetical protein